MGDLVLKKTTTGQITLTPQDVAGNQTVTIPASTGTLSIANTSTSGGIFFGGATSGVLYQDATNLFWDDTNNKLGIGTSSPNSYTGKLSVIGAGIYTDTGYALTGDSTYFTPSGLSAIPNYGLGQPTLSQVSLSGFAGIPFYTNQLERMRVLSTGNILSLSGGSTTATGTGIAFPATQSQSTDVNTLDDYEEGTWNPIVGGTATYGSRIGQYTKIGNLVYVFCDITISTIGTGSTTAISGLPFPASANQGGGVSYYSGLSSSVYFVAPQLSSSSIQFITTTGASGTPNNVASILTSGSRMLVTVMYTTTS